MWLLIVHVDKNGTVCVLGGGTVFTFSLKASGVCFRNKGKGKAPKLYTERSLALYPVNFKASSLPVSAFLRETN